MARKPKLTAKQELFCQYYILGCPQHNLRLGNAVQSYALAYKGKLLEPSDKDYSAVGAAASQNLKKQKIQARIREIKQEAGWNDDSMDSRLREIALSGEESSSVSAIREYNRVMGRIVDKKSLTDEEGNDLLGDLLDEIRNEGKSLRPAGD